MNLAGGVVSLSILVKKRTLLDLTNSQTPSFRMQWHPFSLSSALEPVDPRLLSSPASRAWAASEARLLRPGRFCGGSASGSLLRIDTCGAKELKRCGMCIYTKKGVGPPWGRAKVYLQDELLR